MNNIEEWVCHTRAQNDRFQKLSGATLDIEGGMRTGGNVEKDE
ncbi:hypothetical protein WAK64_10440 [Bacillus spongiae]|uniref:Uncharacterized protein n=1 Tax=Bacillus spongiae TaxID=2683610 RepID=A0ABU8HDZ0_9BACI